MKRDVKIGNSNSEKSQDAPKDAIIESMGRFSYGPSISLSVSPAVDALKMNHSVFIQNSGEN